MRILLVVPAVDTCYEYVPPIGLMNLYLIAKEMGCEVELLDLSMKPYKEGIKKILAKQYDLIGVTANFSNAIPYCVHYPKDVRKKYPNTIFITGGNHATLLPEDLLYHGYDYVVYGEGEATFKEFIKKFLSKKSIKKIKGICYLKDKKIIKNPPRKPINLDTLPINDYSEFDLKPYFKLAKMRYINIETSRGCNYNCSFCVTVKMWGKYRHKSPERILKEFKIAENLGCEFLFINDDDFALDEQHVRKVCRLLIKEKINFPWGIPINSNSIKDESTYDLLKKAGCIKIGLCVESANPRILKEYRKPFTFEQHKRTVNLIKKRGILVQNHGMIGAPGETLREALRTYLYLFKSSPIWHISILEPRPGNDYWKTWDKKKDINEYRLFGKANVILPETKISFYFLYRFFALFYFLSPTRIKGAFFTKNKAIRYMYKIQYEVAYRTIKENLLGFFRGIKNLFSYKN